MKKPTSSKKKSASKGQQWFVRIHPVHTTQHTHTYIHPLQEMLPTAKTHLAELRDKSAGMSAKLERMAGQWEEVRLPLEQEVREKTRQRDERRQRSAELVAESRAMKSEMADMVQDLKVKGPLSLLTLQCMCVCMYVSIYVYVFSGICM